jgi:excisionase family DNA binding protein
MKALRGVVGAAGFLAISTWSVRKLERQKKLKAVRIGRRVLFEEEELERFVAESKRVQEPLVGQNPEQADVKPPANNNGTNGTNGDGRQ